MNTSKVDKLIEEVYQAIYETHRGVDILQKEVRLQLVQNRMDRLVEELHKEMYAIKPCESQL